MQILSFETHISAIFRTLIRILQQGEWGPVYQWTGLLQPAPVSPMCWLTSWCHPNPSPHTYYHRLGVVLVFL